MPACLPSLRQLLGTPWAPTFSGAILALEAPGHGYRVRDADADLAHLANAGALDAVAAVVLGRWEAWSANDVARFDDLVVDYTRHAGPPVVAGYAFSHASPTLTLPIGVLARLDGTNLVITGPAVAS